MNGRNVSSLVAKGWKTNNMEKIWVAPHVLVQFIRLVYACNESLHAQSQMKGMISSPASPPSFEGLVTGLPSLILEAQKTSCQEEAG